MADQSAIEWTDATWNPVTGCDRVSPGCAHCYALDLAARLKRMGNARYQNDGDPKSSGPGFGVTLHPDVLEKPLKWRKPRRVFVNSMSDLFHEEVPDEYIVRVFGIMANAPQHTFQVLTKRPERMWELLRSWTFHKAVAREIGDAVAPEPANGWATIAWADDGYLDNVWLGVSIENRRFVHRADLLRETPAAVRFISAEPLLGPLIAKGGFFARGTDGGYHSDWSDGYVGDDLNLTDIDWLIVGGESGPNHRPIEAEWVRDLREHCVHQRYNQDGGPNLDLPGTRFFFKQWGGRTPKSGGRELDGRTWDEFPTGDPRA